MTESLTLTYAQAAEFVGVSRTTIARAVASKRLPVVFLGEGQTKPRIKRAVLIEWVESAPTERSA